MRHLQASCRPHRNSPALCDLSTTFRAMQQRPAASLRAQPPATGLLAPPQPHPQPCPPPARPPQQWQQAASLCLGLASALAAVAAPPPVAASIPLGPATSQQSIEAQRAWAASQLGGRYVPSSSAAAPPPAEAEPTSVRIQRLQVLMKAGNEAAAEGRYQEALSKYEAVVQQFPDLATTEYARLARGLMLYQLGRTSDAILQLEDLEVTLRGYAEVHAALAAMLWTERPILRPAAETQWEIAMEFNRQFADRDWVARTKHWPPRLMAALDRFLRLE